MTVNPADIMRSYIIDMDTYGLAEQAGKFCEAFREELGSDLSPFDGMEFTYSADEPYDAVFIWDIGEIRAKLSFLGDPDDSTWAVTSRRRRFRGAVSPDMRSAARSFIDRLGELRREQ